MMKKIPLFFNDTLYPITKAFAKDMGKHGKMGHTNSKRQSFGNRTSSFGYLGENCSYGYNKALDIVFQLMLDEGVPSLGHRKNILNLNYHIIVVSIHKHKKWDWNCVVDFAS